MSPKARYIKGVGWEVPPMLDVTEQANPRGEGSRARAVRPAGHGTCPACHTTHKVGLVKVGKHLVWKVHERVTMSNARMVCPASGVSACVMPGMGADDPGCPHY